MRAAVLLPGILLLAACGAGGPASQAGSSPREYRVATGVATPDQLPVTGCPSATEAFG